MCSREFERQRRKIAIVCNYSVICNGVGDCLKCPHLRELQVIDLLELERKEPVAVVNEGCTCN